MSNQKLFPQNIVLNIAKNRCNSAQTSTKYWSISLKFGLKIHLPHTKSDCIGFRITSGIPVVSHVSYVIQEGENTAQMAVSGNADIFSIKVDSRLKTTLIHTGVAPEMNFSSVFIQKFISSPKCRFRECSWRG